MARCRKILANGKRCKVAAISGTRYCVFHTTGKGMRRTKKKSSEQPDQRVGYDAQGRKKFWRRTAENQFAVRSTKYVGAYLVASGTAMRNRPDYTVIRRYHVPRYNRQGRVMVGGHWQKTIEPTRSDYGRNFQQTDHAAQNRKRKGSARRIKAGRVLPVLGYGYMAYNILGQPTSLEERRPGTGWVYADALYAAEGLFTEGAIAYAEGSSLLQSVDVASGASYGFSDVSAKIGELLFA
jgi:hypothetical protein